MSRFVPVAERSYESVLLEYPGLKPYYDSIQRTKWTRSRWKGRTLVKDPMTLSLYLQLLQELEPRTILELGTDEGGSALWLHDVMAMLGRPCEVHTFDIDVDRVRLPDTIGVHQMDNHRVREFMVAADKLFVSLQHPILVIEDAHENFVEVLEQFDRFLQPGDYVVVEDTIDPGKHAAMAQFAEGRFLVDTYYCDFWGLNNSWNFNSFLLKV